MTSQYTMGYDPEFTQLLDRRNAESHAGYFLPSLKPGFRVLDFGCGPGTISVGLAEAVGADGELHGIDLEESQIETARAAALAGGHDNATFHIGDATNLPFEDGYFDAAHCHTLLNHVPDTRAALAEVRRVLKPGGTLGCRELFVASSFVEPSAEIIEEGWAIFTRLLAANGGHPQMGKRLRGALMEAGFSDIRADASFDFFDTPADVAFLHAFIMDWFFSPRVTGAAVMLGLATPERLDEMREALAEWRDAPSACGAFAFGEALAVSD